MPQPNFFIIGAPKCGTTALSHFLSKHPEIHFSYPKEPYYWASDFAGVRRQYGVESMEAYLNLFVSASQQTAAIGEGSTVYLASESAVPAILNFQPDAKFIVMLRNPVEIVVSAHLQEFSHLNESEPDFIKAWQLQEERQRGENIPRSCYEPALLQYRKMAKVGFQFDRLVKAVRPDRIHVIYFEDLKQSMLDVYKSTLSFLNVSYDGRTEFPRVNDSKVPRFRLVSAALNGRTGTVVSRFVKRRLTGRLERFANRAKKLLTTRPKAREAMPEQFIEQLTAEYYDDIRLLADRTGRDLSAWLN